MNSLKSVVIFVLNLPGMILRFILGSIRLGLQLLILWVIVGVGLVACQAATQPPAEEREPLGVQWNAGPAGIQVPSGKAGPNVPTPIPHGYQASTHGAVLAAMNAQAWLAGAGDDAYPLVIEYLLAPGDGALQWAQARSLLTVSDELQSNPPEFVGFQMEEPQGDDAVVVLAVRYPSGVIGAQPVQLSKASGGWRVVLPTQEQAVEMQEITEEQLEKNFVAFGPNVGKAAEEKEK
ncbi:hypothetical protein C1Y63_06225 [Corynebacterium sp. 13CS0277]|uniref:hypothetical protein n=1 Tax=Corynebacterium sp. 13CS0277 TaxID=2071994 RepID=UPI000D045E81|nr:hypothetical protein [Corynebacterium sp. 13CS0277]PRQ11443.1 hypothetical protein C1Y63_06225 [Corynebacterium sp. 13CS0277]